MGDSSVKASFGPLISILTHLVCSLQTTTVGDMVIMQTSTLFEDPKDSTKPKHPMAQQITITEE